MEVGDILTYLHQAGVTRLHGFGVKTHGRGVVVALVGEPGIGKTSLLRDVAEQARRRGFTTGTGKTEEIDQIAPDAPLLVALRSGAQPLLDAAFGAGSRGSGVAPPPRGCRTQAAALRRWVRRCLP